MNVIREIQVLYNAGNYLTSRKSVSFSRTNKPNADVYLRERYIAVDTPVGQSEALCVLQVDHVCFKKNHSEELCKYCRIYM